MCLSMFLGYAYNCVRFRCTLGGGNIWLSLISGLWSSARGRREHDANGPSLTLAFNVVDR